MGLVSFLVSANEPAGSSGAASPAAASVRASGRDTPFSDARDRLEWAAFGAFADMTSLNGGKGNSTPGVVHAEFRAWLRRAASVARALTTVDVKDFARHEAGRLEVEDRVDDVGDLTHMADRVQDAKLRMRLDGMHRRLDGAQGHGVHPDTVLRILDRERFGRSIQAALRQRSEHRRNAGDRVVDQARRDLHDMTAALFFHLGHG